MEALASQQLHIYSSFTLSNDDVSTITLLYAPLIGSDAVQLYLTFASLLERNNLKSETMLHQEIFDLLKLQEKMFLKARYQLEGIGLLTTYTNELEVVYVLCPPMSPKNFIKDATLGIYLYSSIGKNLFDKLYEHFKIEKIDKTMLTNITKNFEDVFTSQIEEDVSFSKFQYLLGKRPKTLKICNHNFDFDKFVKEINKEFLETGITKQFTEQINNTAFVYAFDELQMAGLFHDSINKSGYFDYRLLKKKANILYTYINHLEAPKLLVKNEDDVDGKELIDYLDQASPSEILKSMMPNFPPKYLSTIQDIYANIDLPRGVLNCMIIKVLKDKSGELPTLSYFKKMSETWIENNVFTTSDAVKFVTKFKDATTNVETKPKKIYKTGGFD
ncbi:MAG: hypothetical protein K2I77_04055, partial [Anaeroplasmataceae bacterium]|nr:hypothetical protein [Anaeroplasmataceae bacterium]